MLTSISPLGEQARGQRHGLTVAAHLLGGLLGGATSGAVLGGLGALLPLPARVALLVAGLVCLAGAVADLRGVRLGRRQVDEDWLARYRGWVYGGGYGYQLGLGAVTVVTSAATPVLALLALLTGDLRSGVVLGAVFGLARGLPLLAWRGATTPDLLRTAAARFEAAARPVARSTSALLALAGAALLVGAAT